MITAILVTLMGTCEGVIIEKGLWRPNAPEACQMTVEVCEAGFLESPATPYRMPPYECGEIDGSIYWIEF